jgi:Arc/MetJ-type ribon-helix-helix transcriptional regulator
MQVQLRLPKEMVTEIDEWVRSGRFKSRSDAIRFIIQFYQERERTLQFYQTLVQRSAEARENPEKLISLEEIR